jgi:DNA-binding transcriptional ArsR family regulator
MMPQPMPRLKDEEDAHWPVQAEMRVSDPAAVQLLWYPAKRVHLKPFMGRSVGLAEAANVLGIKKTAMSYWISRLLAVGLIRMRGVRKEPRHRVPLYRCVADRLHVSLTDAPLSSHEGVFDDMDARWHPLTRQALARSLARQAPWLDLKIETLCTSGMQIELAARCAGAPPDDYIYYRARLWLTATERNQLRDDIDALWNRYAALSDQTSKSGAVLVHLVSVPEPAR